MCGNLKIIFKEFFKSNLLGPVPDIAYFSIMHMMSSWPLQKAQQMPPLAPCESVQKPFKLEVLVSISFISSKLCLHSRTNQFSLRNSENELTYYKRVSSVGCIEAALKLPPPQWNLMKIKFSGISWKELYIYWEQGRECTTLKH